jgi:hypothetical protein
MRNKIIETPHLEIYLLKRELFDFDAKNKSNSTVTLCRIMIESFSYFILEVYKVH